VDEKDTGTRTKARPGKALSLSEQTDSYATSLLTLNSLSS